jgi:dipeptidyl aminopeptidase/acylaminoacyl peptidase
MGRPDLWWAGNGWAYTGAMRIPLVLALVCGLVVPGVGVAQTAGAKRAMTFADLMAMRRVSDPQVSVSGKWVLFSVTDVSLEKNSKVNHLWVVPVDGSAKERQVTTGSGEGEGRFSPDGKWVMYAADGQLMVAAWDDAAGAVGAGRAVTSLETGADGGVWAPDSKHFLFASDVYPGCESKEPMGAARNEAEVRCNAERDAAAAKSPVKALVFTDLLYRHWDHYLGEKRSHIFYGDVDGGAPEDLTPASVVGDHVAPTFSLGGPLGYAVSPDGREIAYEVNLDKVPAESTNNDIYVLQVGAEPGTARKVSTSLGSDDGPAYSPDGKWLAWRSQKRNGFESDKFDLVVMDRAMGKVRDLTEGFPNWVDEFTWAPSSDRIFFVSPSAGEEPVFIARLKSPVITELDQTNFSIGGVGTIYRIERPFPAEFSGLTISPDGQSLIAMGMSVVHPASIFRFPLSEILKDLNPTRPTPENRMKEIDVVRDRPSPASNIFHVVFQVLADLNMPLLHSLDLPVMESFWFTGANGTKMEGFVVRPPHFDPAKKYPVKFLIHGGPQGAWGDAWSYRWNPELFAADGYVVVMVNPRGSTGYGQQFVDEVSGDWGGRPFVDLMKGLDAAEAKFPFIDKTRECALGASYGGYMADWVLTHTNRFKCIVTHDGMYDPVSAFGATEELWFAEWEFRPLEAGSRKQEAGSRKGNSDDAGDAVVEQGKPAHPWDFYGKPASEDPFRKWSPMMFIKDARTPTLVVHSQKDYRLDVSQGLQLFTALQLLGVPSKMLYFPDEGHWVLKPQNSELWFETVEDWCDRWVGMGKYAGVGQERNPKAEK